MDRKTPGIKEPKIISFDTPFILKTKRILLRSFKVSDITEGYVKALNDETVIGLTESRYRSWTQSQAVEYVKKKANIQGTSHLVGIFINQGKKHIGNIRLHSFSPHNSRVEIGILIWDKREWGKGYGTEALQVLIDYIFINLKLHKICAEYYAINKGSKKMFEKLKFVKEGVFKDYYFVANKYIDAVRVAKINPKL